MTIEEIEAALGEALSMRVPRFDPDTPGRAKVEALEDYLLAAAWHHAELEEALHYLDFTIALLREKVEKMTGYEAALPPRTPSRITKADVLAAKQLVDPAIFDAGTRAKQIRASVVRQIARFEFDKEVVSRAYTLISGGS